jgi:hypothetical protein
VFRIDSDQTAALRDIPYAYVPMVFLQIARMLFQQTVNRVVGVNRGERLRRANLVDNDVLAFMSCRSLGSVNVKMALMDHGIPVDWINFLDHFPFVVIDDDVIFKGFFDFGQELSMDDGNFLGSIGVFWLKFKTGA